MSLSEPYDDRLMADLAAAADGTLDPARQAEIEAMAASDAELADALERQRRAITLIRGATADIQAPLALRERLEADRQRLAKPRARRRWFSVALAGAAAAAVLLAIVLATPGGATVEDAAALATAPATAPAPAAAGALLDIQQDGIPFPAWVEKFGWEATGSRTDELDGRSTTTVFYEKDGKTLAYTIVGGDALDVPDGTGSLNAEGTPGGRCRGTAAGSWRRGNAKATPASSAATASTRRSWPSSPVGRARAQSRSRRRRRRVMPLASGAEAFRALVDEPERVTKVVLMP